MERIIKKVLYKITDTCMPIYNKIVYKLQAETKSLVVYNTALHTKNLGDEIIMKYCDMILCETFDGMKRFDISTHEIPDKEMETIVKKSNYKIVCGTNLLTSHIEQWWNWRLPDGIIKKLPYRNAILFGVGWGAYQDDCSEYTKIVYHSLLNPVVWHSVRDQYTVGKLKAIGITNVINTGCPTMWRLTPELCGKIPCGKADNVITTVTDYRQDVLSDNIMLETLGKYYKTVFLWLQGSTDKDYIKQLKLPDNLQLIEADLDAYEKILRQGDIDYIGTRLHAGIFALNHGVRSLVVAVDNRAVEIAKDTNLPIIHRKNLRTDLARLINENRKTDIRINRDNIERFLMQFNKG